MSTSDDVTHSEDSLHVAAETDNAGPVAPESAGTDEVSPASEPPPEEPAAAEAELPPDPEPEAAPEEVEVPAEPVAPGFAWAESLFAVPLSAGWDAEPVVVDWFDTGEPCLLVCHGGGPGGRSAALYRPVGKAEGSWLPVYDDGRRVEGLDGLRCLCVLPNGGPTRFDLVGLATDGLVLLRNQGTAEAPAFGPRESLGLAADLGFGAGQVSQMVAVDWDGDGLVDLLVGFNHAPDYWPDPGVPVEQQIGLNQRGGHPGYDRRGLWRGNVPVGRLHWLQNVGKLGEPRFETRPEICSDLESLELGMHPAPLALAWGGGGGLELMTIDQRGLIKLYRNFGGQRPPVLMEPRVVTCGGAPLLLPEERALVSAADLDGDRKLELIYGAADGRIFAVHSGAGRDTAQNPVPFMSRGGSLRLGGRAVLTCGDLDGDGGVDLVYGDGPGRLMLLKDVGQGPDHRYQAPVEIEAAGERYQVDPGPDGRLLGPIAPKLGFACPTLVDWAAHDRLDLIVGTAGGEILNFSNDGSKNQPRFAYPVPVKCSGAPLIVPPRIRPGAAIWESGELPDLFALDLQGFLAVFPRVGPNEVGPPEPIVDRLGRLIRLDGAFGQGGRCNIWAGPWTGSGRTDLLVGIPREARYLVPGIVGRVRGGPDAWPTVLLFENVGHNMVVPRALQRSEGTPLVVGTHGCSPTPVDATGTGRLDLLVAGDDGSLHYLRRDELTW